MTLQTVAALTYGLLAGLVLGVLLTARAAARRVNGAISRYYNLRNGAVRFLRSLTPPAPGYLDSHPNPSAGAAARLKEQLAAREELLTRIREPLPKADAHAIEVAPGRWQLTVRGALTLGDLFLRRRPRLAPGQSPGDTVTWPRPPAGGA